MPAGSKLVTTYTFDNSKRNPANPDPSKTITWGEQSWQEMHYTQLRYTWTGETTKQPVDYDKILANNRALGILDANIDGFVEKSELKGALGKGLLVQFAKLDANGDGKLDSKELAPVAGALGRRGEEF